MKRYAETDMTIDEIVRALDKASRRGAVFGPLSRSEKAAGGRICLRRGRRGDTFSFTHKAPDRYSAVPAVLRGKVYDGALRRRICWRVSKARPRAAAAGIGIVIMLLFGAVRLWEGYYASGATVIVLALLLSLVAFLPSREERELLRSDLYSMLRCKDGG